MNGGGNYNRPKVAKFLVRLTNLPERIVRYVHLGNYGKQESNKCKTRLYAGTSEYLIGTNYVKNVAVKI